MRRPEDNRLQSFRDSAAVGRAGAKFDRPKFQITDAAV